MKYSVRVQGREFAVTVDGEAPRYHLTIDGEPLQVDATDLGDEALLAMLVDHESRLAHTGTADLRRGWVEVAIGGKVLHVEVLDELAAAAQHAAESDRQGRFVLAAPTHVAALEQLVRLSADGFYEDRRYRAQVRLADAYLAHERWHDARVLAEALRLLRPDDAVHLARLTRALVGLATQLGGNAPMQWAYGVAGVAVMVPALFAFMLTAAAAH